MKNASARFHSIHAVLKRSISMLYYTSFEAKKRLGLEGSR